MKICPKKQFWLMVKSITIHNFLLEYYDLKVKEKDSRKKKTTHDFLLDSYNLSNKNKNIELSKAHNLFQNNLFQCALQNQMALLLSMFSQKNQCFRKF